MPPPVLSDDPKMTNKLFCLLTLILVVLYTIIVCAVITQDVNLTSTEQKYVNERRAHTGLKWMSIPILVSVFVANVMIIFTL